MRYHHAWFTTVACMVGVATVLTAAPVLAQDEEGVFAVGRTPWGDPDLQGIWNSKTATPLERPDTFEGREFLTDQEIAELEGNALQWDEGDGAGVAQERGERGTARDVAGAYNSVFSSRGTSVVRTKRTSLVIDPPDGKIPYSEAGLERVAAEVAYRKELMAADLETLVYMAKGPEDRPNDRCLGFTLPCTSMYCAYSRIVQTPGLVTIYYEAGHTGGAYRRIPLDRRPHLPSHMRQWYGDSVGHWEGDTLVVDTTNFTDRRSVEGTSTPIGFRGSGEGLPLIERFTRVAPDMTLYQVTVENPLMYSRPWTLEIPWVQPADIQHQIFESACHEGNYGLTGILAGARAIEANATGSK